MIKIPLFLRDAFWMLVAVFLADRSFHLVINDFHTSFLDVFFKYFTHLGDGLVFLPLILYFLFLHRPTAFVLMIAGVLTLFLTAVLKQVIFEGVSRPVQYFGVEKLHLIKGVSMAHWNSFPSGHTTTDFAIFSVVVQKIKYFFWK